MKYNITLLRKPTCEELELKINDKFKSMEVSKSKSADVADDDDVFDGAEA
jgi:hypothetical protein